MYIGPQEVFVTGIFIRFRRLIAYFVITTIVAFYISQTPRVPSPVTQKLIEDK